jgi:hypothetical protein
MESSYTLPSTQRRSVYGKESGLQSYEQINILQSLNFLHRDVYLCKIYFVSYIKLHYKIIVIT